MQYHQAQDTFVAALEDGTETLVTKGSPYPGSHELVKRDIAAGKDNPGRTPLFRPLAEDEAAPALRRSAGRKDAS